MVSACNGITVTTARDDHEAVVRAESYLDSNVNIPLVFQQLTMTLEEIFAASDTVTR